MITARTKRQLLVFAVITLLGVTYVGARYAQLDRLFYDPTYTVDVALAESGGIFTDAEVTYRGVQVGRVTDMRLTRDGVDVELSIDDEHDRIPADALALVGNKSAVGEQYVELQPETDDGPYLREGSSIASEKTETPVQATELLTNLSNLVTSLPQSDVRTVISESGAAFEGTGDDLGQIIDTQSSFIEAADANFETTRRLIRDGRVVLQTQLDKESAIRSFSRDLALFTGTVADSDAELRRVIEEGSATATELRVFLEQNQVDLGELINNLLTTNEVVRTYLPGIRQLLVVYPYVVAGGYTVTRAQGDGTYNARFGLVLTTEPGVCTAGYEDFRQPSDRQPLPMPTDVGCRDGSTTLRGSEKAPGRAGTAYRSPVASYDEADGELTWADDEPQVAYDGGAASVFGADSWKYTLLQPALADAAELEE